MDELKALKEFQQRIGYTFNDEKLLYEALSHSSFANENKKTRRSNERLEFLGESHTWHTDNCSPCCGLKLSAVSS